MKHRLKDRIGSVKYKVIGEPTDIKGAEALKQEDKYQFQWWALGLVDARPSESEQKKGADGGIDGYIYFHDGIKTETKAIIIQVKSGHTGVKDIRDLSGTISREKDGAMGILISLNRPTGEMIKEALRNGYYKSPMWGNLPKIQIITIKELLTGNQPKMPHHSNPHTYNEKKVLPIDKKQSEIRFISLCRTSV